MNLFFYFCGAVLAGIVTSLGCALMKIVNANPDRAVDYPDDRVIDDKITKKRVVWIFVWILQGTIGGLIAAFSFKDAVFENNFSPYFVWVLSFILGSVSWFDFKKSISAIKELKKFNG